MTNFWRRGGEGRDGRYMWPYRGGGGRSWWFRGPFVSLDWHKRCCRMLGPLWGRSGDAEDLPAACQGLSGRSGRVSVVVLGDALAGHLPGRGGRANPGAALFGHGVPSGAGREGDAAVSVIMQEWEVSGLTGRLLRVILSRVRTPIVT